MNLTVPPPETEPEQLLSEPAPLSTDFTFAEVPSFGRVGAKEAVPPNDLHTVPAGGAGSARRRTRRSVQASGLRRASPRLCASGSLLSGRARRCAPAA